METPLVVEYGAVDRDGGAPVAQTKPMHSDATLVTRKRVALLAVGAVVALALVWGSGAAGGRLAVGTLLQAMGDGDDESDYAATADWFSAGLHDVADGAGESCLDSLLVDGAPFGAAAGLVTDEFELYVQFADTDQTSSEFDLMAPAAMAIAGPWRGEEALAKLTDVLAGAPLEVEGFRMEVDEDAEDDDEDKDGLEFGSLAALGPELTDQQGLDEAKAAFREAKAKYNEAAKKYRDTNAKYIKNAKAYKVLQGRVKDAERAVYSAKNAVRKASQKYSAMQNAAQRAKDARDTGAAALRQARDAMSDLRKGLTFNHCRIKKEVLLMKLKQCLKAIPDGVDKEEGTERCTKKYPSLECKKPNADDLCAHVAGRDTQHHMAPSVVQVDGAEWNAQVHMYTNDVAGGGGACQAQCAVLDVTTPRV